MESSHRSSDSHFIPCCEERLSLFSILGLQMICGGFKLAPSISALFCCWSDGTSFPIGWFGYFWAVKDISLLRDTISSTSKMAFWELFRLWASFGSLGGSGGGLELSSVCRRPLGASKGTIGPAPVFVTSCWRGSIGSAVLLGFRNSSLSSEFLKEFTGCGDKLLDQPLSLETKYILSFGNNSNIYA